MSAMIDPHEGYMSFKKEVELGNLLLKQCRIYPELQVHFDEAEGEMRITYTILQGKTPKGILQVTKSGWENDILYFQLGIAVGEEFRNQGIGSELSRKGLEEFLACFPLPVGKKRGIEAVISETNIASQRVAAKIFADPPIKIIDNQSCGPALRYEFVEICETNT